MNRNSPIASKLPLTFLILISIWWGYYYSVSSELNDFGNANFEWLFMLDALLVLPVLCFVVEPDKKTALLKAAILCCTAVLIGSVIIPEQNKVLFQHFENGRYLVLAVIITMEVMAITTVILAVRASLLNHNDPDNAIANPIKQIFGESLFSEMLTFEGRIWMFALFSSRIKRQHYLGEHHFSYDEKDGAKSNLLGFILVILFEIPLVHVLLHFLWSSMAANITTGLTVFGLLFFYAEYKAVSKRPISISANNLIIRYGVYQPYVIPLNSITTIQKNAVFIKRQRGIKRFNYSGVPNIVIKLNRPLKGKDTVYLGVNSPDTFIKEINNLRS